MLDHHIQRSIVYSLAFAEKLRFSDLKPDDIENKLFTYHLKKVLAEGYVQKNENGTYSLTADGRRVGKGALKKQSRFIDRAYSVLFLVVKKDDSWLLYTRKTHPLLGLTGFMQAQPVPESDIISTAERTLTQKTGLTGSFSVITNGYFRIFREKEVESFTHFTLLLCESPIGELSQQDAFGDYAWVTNPDFKSETMLPTAATLSSAALSATPTFIDKMFIL